MAIFGVGVGFDNYFWVYWCSWTTFIFFVSFNFNIWYWLNFWVIFNFFVALMGYFWGWGRVDKLFWGLLMKLKDFSFLCFLCFLFYVSMFLCCFQEDVSWGNSYTSLHLSRISFTQVLKSVFFSQIQRKYSFFFRKFCRRRL